ncbi:MAG: hypothetical protein V3U95_09450 [Dehalococcoidia bacterium]
MPQDWDTLVGEIAPMPEQGSSQIFVGVDASKGALKGSDTTAVVASGGRGSRCGWWPTASSHLPLMKVT